MRRVIVLLLAATATWAATAPQTTINVKDGSGSSQTVNTMPQVGAAGTPSTDVLSVQGVSGGTALPIQGGTAVGLAPTMPPVAVSGVDGGGLKRHILTDTTGAVQVVSAGVPAALGPLDPPQSMSVTLANATQTTQLNDTALNTNLMTGNISDWYDALNANCASIQLRTSAGITGSPVVTFEQTNDITNVPAGNAWLMTQDTSLSTLPSSTSGTLSSSTTYQFSGPVNARYVRARISTAPTAGDISAFSTFSRLTWVRPTMFGRITDGTNSMPTMDAASRKGFFQISDGTNSASVLATILALKTDLSSIAGTATVTAGVSGMAAVGGNVAISAAATANPLGVGGRVSTTNDTTLVDNDVAALSITTGRQALVKQFSPPELDWQYATPIASPITNTTAVAVKAAGAASIRNYVTGLQYQNTSAVASVVTVQDNITVIWTGYAPAAMTAPATVTFNTPLRGTAATAMNFVVATTATNTFVSAQGYQAP